MSGLRGRRVLITRPRHQQAGLVAQLESRGASVAAVAMVRIEPLYEPCEVAARVPEVAAGRARIVVFTSANAVEQTLLGLDHGHGGARYLTGATVCAIGPATAAVLRRHGVEAQVMPGAYVAETVAAALEALHPAGAHVWLPRAQAARDVLPDRLRAAGAEVEVLPLYRSVLPEGAHAALAAVLDAGPLDAVVFTSASTVRHFILALGGRLFPDGAVAACIGPITAAAALQVGLPPGPVAAEHSTTGLVDALAAWFSG